MKNGESNPAELCWGCGFFFSPDGGWGDFGPPGEAGDDSPLKSRLNMIVFCFLLYLGGGAIDDNLRFGLDLVLFSGRWNGGAIWACGFGCTVQYCAGGK